MSINETEKENAFNIRIGKIIQLKRVAKRFTQQEVAEYLEIGNEAVSRIERGITAPSLYRLCQLADLFGCTPEDFFIEGSGRVTENVQQLTRLLEPLSKYDRQILLDIVKTLVDRFHR